MRLAQEIKFLNDFVASIYDTPRPRKRLKAGGQGSGPNAPCPQCGPKTGGNGKHGHRAPLPGDRVTLLKPVRSYIEKSPHGKTRHPGAKATVVAVLPKVGDTPAMLKIRFGTDSLNHYVKADDVAFHKAVKPPIGPRGGYIKSRPVPKQKRLSQTTHQQEGFRYTVIKPSRRGRPKLHGHSEAE